MAQSNKSLVIPLAMVIAFAISGFAMNTDAPVHQTEKSSDNISGTYFMHGYQVTMKLCYLDTDCESGEALSRDTIRTSFIVNIKTAEGEEDLLIFSGLEGADMRIRNASYSGSAAYTNRCKSTTNPRDCAHAKRTGDELEFDIISPFGWYSGRGEVNNGELTLETIFRYRGAGVEYSLKGTKIEDES